LRLFRITALSAMCLLASSGLVAAEEVAQPAEKAEPVLKYDPEFPDSMVVATVNSVPITVGEVLEPVRKHLEENLLQQKIPTEKRAEIRAEWVEHFLPELIDRKLRVQGLTSHLTAEQQQALDKYLDKTWEEYTVELRKENRVSTMRELEEEMEREGTSLEKVKRVWREASMAHQFVLLKVDSSYAPTSKELHDYYEEHAAEWSSPTRVKWQQILVKRQRGERYAVAKRRAHELIEKLQDGADFAELARAHSEGPTKAQGGNWVWTESDGLVCVELREFLSAGKVGSTSDVISYKDEVHIARILERQDARRKRFEEVEPEIRDILKKADREAQARKALRELADKAVIKTVFGDEWKFEVLLLEDSPKGRRRVSADVLAPLVDQSRQQIDRTKDKPKAPTESLFRKALNEQEPPEADLPGTLE
jgi:peptidyl-prolyl cis-trans isomerase SurA